jgi:hypothetical protein
MSMAAMSNALATNIVINPGLPGVTNVSTTGPAGWIAGFYNFALIIAGILAFGAIVYGGVRAAASAGNPSGISEGRAWIYSALLGLLLLGCAWLILHTINPNLTKLQVPTLSTVNTQNTQSSNPGSNGVTCTSPSFACGLTCCAQGQMCSSQSGIGPTCSGQPTNGCGVCGGSCNGTCPAGKTCTNVPSYGYVCG